MGLDQYLYAKKYLSPSEFAGSELNHQYGIVVSAVKAENYVHKVFPSAEVAIKVGQWRKENAIHYWFVQNCQEGIDNCREHFVEREQLRTLLSLCETVLLDHQVTGSDELANELLPTGEFEPTMDEWYYNGLEDTIAIIKGCFEMNNQWEFYYQSSW